MRMSNDQIRDYAKFAEYVHIALPVSTSQLSKINTFLQGFKSSLVA